MIFGLRRYSKIFKIHSRNVVILNIRAFHAQDATIQNIIENTSQNSSKIIENWSKKRVQNQAPCRGPFWEPFWVYFGFVLDPFSTIWRPMSSKIVPGGLLNTTSIFHYFCNLFQVAPAAGGGGFRRKLTT